MKHILDRLLVRVNKEEKEEEKQIYYDIHSELLEKYFNKSIQFEDLFFEIHYENESFKDRLKLKVLAEIYRESLHN